MLSGAAVDPSFTARGPTVAPSWQSLRGGKFASPAPNEPISMCRVIRDPARLVARNPPAKRSRIRSALPRGGNVTIIAGVDQSSGVIAGGSWFTLLDGSRLSSAETSENTRRHLGFRRRRLRGTIVTKSGVSSVQWVVEVASSAPSKSSIKKTSSAISSMRYCRRRDVVELLCDPAPGRLDDCGLGSAHFLWTASPARDAVTTTTK